MIEDKIMIVIEPARIPNSEPVSCLSANSLPRKLTGVVLENKFTHRGPGMPPNTVITTIENNTIGTEREAEILFKKKKINAPTNKKDTR